MDTRFADTAFGRIEYLDRGPGRPVLVLHGTPGGHDQGSLMADFVVAAGLRELEVCSFVPPRLMPQMADAAEVVRHALTHPGLTVMALVPNLHGARAALAAGVHKLTLPVSASQAHSLANVRKTPAEMVDVVRQVARLRDEMRVRRNGGQQRVAILSNASERRLAILERDGDTTRRDHLIMAALDAFGRQSQHDPIGARGHNMLRKPRFAPGLGQHLFN